jgi:1,2-dihydroxy-3-keto-5-methylthiopentene dioxygenase
MVAEAWYMDDATTDQRAPHRRDPNEPVHLDTLKALGVNYWALDPTIWETDPKLAALRAQHGYSYHDILECSPAKLPCYEDKIQMFYKEHLHADDEVRYCLAGSGYFDVRDQADRWIRIHVRPGDLISLPAGIYHRYTNDENNHITALRLFVGDPVWVAINRPEADEHPTRSSFLKKVQTNTFVAESA